ncbi:nucleoside diphosphate kinase [Pseudovibrio denitrificans]|uniref:Nucleoside diphosphate kinase n=1 Tax=Pseudovibrio denitrificans TaxID=258256 RepID=A0A1I7CQU8_9HYPH|nr:nucleoside-diphosphate kinase [Pseudovibrio denitrificans]SFU01830.1 nucleoside diphosphate kinase [Pseudovibrio denitrificans]
MEHNILVIKPDQEKQVWFVEGIKADLVQSGLEIVAICKKHLDADEFNRCFICKNGTHLAYMTNSPVVAVLYKGRSAVSFGRNYKYKIRKQHAADKLRNILHSTEPGNEFAAQFDLFFPTLRVADHHQFSDQGVCFNQLNIDQVDRLPELTSFNLVAMNEIEANSPQFKAVSSLRNCRYVAIRDTLQSEAEVLRYRQKQASLSSGMREVNILLLKRPQNASSVIKLLKEQQKIQGVVCYKPSFTLLQTEMLRTAIFKNDLFCVGGSFGEGDPG